LKYIRVGKAEMKPDVYGGESCEEHIPRWMGYLYEDDETDLEIIKLDPKAFPAGTKILIEIPICPKCELQQELCKCGFDWMGWINESYS